MHLIFVSLLQCALGIVILFGGSEIAVRGAVNLARMFKIPAVVVGLVIIAYGTASPELMVSLHAATGGSPDIALGTIIGSNIANILLVLGAVACITPVNINPQLVRRDGLVMLGATVMLFLFALDEEISRAEGMIMLAALAVYTWAAVHSAWGKEKAGEAEEEMKSVPSSACSWCAVAYIFVGLGMLMTGADILVDGAVALARRIHVSEAVIGLTVVAAGTSVPELVTSLVAARRGQRGISIANIIGSNIFNILGIAGVSAFFNPIPVAPHFLAADFWILLAVTLFILVFMRTGRQLSRREGMVCLALFAVYGIYQYVFT